ncbi:MAG: prephenate dehydrogenase [Candidatus Omnitrophota bacterium]
MNKRYKICIIGVGLIGGSLALAFKKNKLALQITGCGRNPEKLHAAKRLGIINKYSLSVKDAINEADIIIIATPVGQILKFAKDTFAYAKKGAIVVDVGSTKSQIVTQIEKIVPHDIYFIGCHPLAGSEKFGAQHASAALFLDSYCIITVTPRTNKRALRIIKSLWVRIGSSVVTMSPARHDSILSLISHLPHIVSVALIRSVDSKYFKFAAGGLKDTTRIASSEPLMWRDICVSNRSNIIHAIEQFEKYLKKIKNALSESDDTALLEELKAAQRRRDLLADKNQNAEKATG